MREEDSDLYDADGNFDPICAKAKNFTSYETMMENLECPELENNELFKKLKRKIVKFFIENGAERGAPKYMEWYGAFGLLVTLIWLYLEILRLLAKLSSRR